MIMMFISSYACGQELDKVQIKKDSIGLCIKEVRYNNSPVSTRPTNAKEFFVKALGANSNDIFEKKVTHIGNRNIRDEFYQQRYKGLIVDGGGYVIHYHNGMIQNARGNYIPKMKIDTNPRIDSMQAFTNFAKHKSIPLQDITGHQASLQIKLIADNKTGTYNPYLVYKVILFSNNLNNDEIGYVDAVTGKIVTTSPLVYDIREEARFETLYSSTKTGYTQYYNGYYHLTDSAQQNVITVADCANTPYSNELKDNDNNWTQDEYPNKQNMAFDIIWSLEQVTGYLYDTYNIKGIDNNKFQINAYSRAILGTETANAYWNTANKNLFFGVGGYSSGIHFNPFCSLDVVAHELGHGITQFNIGWNEDRTKEFHEGLSDIWGVIMLHRILNYTDLAWKMGKQLSLDGSCIRDIAQTDGGITTIANTYGSTKYNEMTDPHALSGVLSHWYYLLVMGGKGTNEINHAYQVKGVGFDLAEELIVTAVFGNYLRFTTSYQEIRKAFEHVARDVMQNKRLYIQVSEAWYAVGVGESYYNSVKIVGYNGIYREGDYHLIGIPKEASVKWSNTHPLGAIDVVNDSTIHYKVNRLSTGTISDVIKVDITYDGETFERTYPVTVGLGIKGLQVIKYSGENIVVIQPTCEDVKGGIEAIWEDNPIISENPFADDASFQNNKLSALAQVPTTGVYKIGAKLRYNGEDMVNYYYQDLNIEASPNSQRLNFTISPNPASSYVNLGFKELDSDNVTNVLKIQSSKAKGYRYKRIMLWKMTSLIKRFKTDQDTFTMDVSELSPGLYYIQVINKGKSYGQKLMIKQ